MPVYERESAHFHFLKTNSRFAYSRVAFCQSSCPHRGSSPSHSISCQTAFDCPELRLGGDAPLEQLFVPGPVELPAAAGLGGAVGVADGRAALLVERAHQAELGGQDARRRQHHHPVHHLRVGRARQRAAVVDPVGHAARQEGGHAGRVGHLHRVVKRLDLTERLGQRREAAAAAPVRLQRVEHAQHGQAVHLAERVLHAVVLHVPALDVQFELVEAAVH